LPSGGVEKHPCIILSNNEINSIESGFVAVMMTSTFDPDDEYTFVIKDDMVNKPLSKPCAVRLHLIGNFMNRDIISNTYHGYEILKNPFNRIIANINSITFGIKLEM